MLKGLPSELVEIEAKGHAGKKGQSSGGRKVETTRIFRLRSRAGGVRRSLFCLRQARPRSWSARVAHRLPSQPHSLAIVVREWPRV